MRSRLASGPPLPLARQAAIVSVDLVIGCIRSVEKRISSGPGRLKVAELAGMSYLELVTQSLNAPGNGDENCVLEQPQIYCRMHQTSFIDAIIDADSSPDLNAAISSKRIVTFSATLMKAIEKTPQYAHSTDPNRDPSSFDWHDTMVIMWRLILEGASKRNDPRPAVEAVEANVVFLLETWSIHAFENQTGERTILYAEDRKFISV